MEKQEWFEYFEAVNGRKPTLEEFSKAKASGFFEKKKASEKEENITSPQQETPLSPKQVRENWVKDFELNHGRKPSFEEFFEGVEALKQPATNPAHQTVSTQALISQTLVLVIKLISPLPITNPKVMSIRIHKRIHSAVDQYHLHKIHLNGLGQASQILILQGHQVLILRLTILIQDKQHL